MKEDTRQRMLAEGLRVWHERDQENGGHDVDDRDTRQFLVPLPVGQTAGASLTRLATVQPKQTRWLWPGHIPFGALTLIVGDPGLGKSQLTLDLAARVSQGAEWPDGSTSDVANVLLLSSEDSVDRTIMPRLVAAGAELSRIIVLDTVEEAGKPRLFNLKKDLAVLEQSVADNYVDLVIIDPLNGYLGDTNSWKESEVRNVLAPACKMADEHDVALIGVIHLNKDNAKSAIHRVLGSIAFGAITRAMFAVAPHIAYPGLRYFVSVKQNYTKPPPTLGFVMVEGGGIQWDGRTYDSVTADSILAVGGPPEDKAERRAARDFLLTILANGPVRTKEIKAAQQLAMISDPALKRAKYDLKVEHVHVGSPTGTGTGGYWTWRLP